MKKFRFTLETLLKKEKFDEKLRLEELSEIRHILKKAIVIEAEVITRINQTKADKKNDRRATIDSFKEYRRYMKDLMEKRKEAEENIRMIKIQEAKRLDKVRESQKSIKVLDKLREKQYTEFMNKVKREEEKKLEELVSQKYIREQSERV